MIDEKKIIESIKTFLGEEGINYLKEFKDKDMFYLAWGSALYGSVGMQVRNYLRDKHTELDKEFTDYGEFEDYSTEIMLKILK